MLRLIRNRREWLAILCAMALQGALLPACEQGGTTTAEEGDETSGGGRASLLAGGEQRSLERHGAEDREPLAPASDQTQHHSPSRAIGGAARSVSIGSVRPARARVNSPGVYAWNEGSRAPS